MVFEKPISSRTGGPDQPIYSLSDEIVSVGAPAKDKFSLIDSKLAKSAKGSADVAEPLLLPGSTPSSLPIRDRIRTLLPDYPIPPVSDTDTSRSPSIERAIKQISDTTVAPSDALPPPTFVINFSATLLHPTEGTTKLLGFNIPNSAVQKVLSQIDEAGVQLREAHERALGLDSKNLQAPGSPATPSTGRMRSSSFVINETSQPGSPATQRSGVLVFGGRSRALSLIDTTEPKELAKGTFASAARVESCVIDSGLISQTSNILKWSNPDVSRSRDDVRHAYEMLRSFGRNIAGVEEMPVEGLLLKRGNSVTPLGDQELQSGDSIGYFTHDYKGGDLQTLLYKARDPELAEKPEDLTLEEYASASQTLSQALAELHSLKSETGEDIGIQHADIKLPNLLVESDGTGIRKPVISDFGGARSYQMIKQTIRELLRGDGLEASKVEELQNNIIGTRTTDYFPEEYHERMKYILSEAYVQEKISAPEAMAAGITRDQAINQICDEYIELSKKADKLALGITLFEMIAGRNDVYVENDEQDTGAGWHYFQLPRPEEVGIDITTIEDCAYAVDYLTEGLVDNIEGRLPDQEGSSATKSGVLNIVKNLLKEGIDLSVMYDACVRRGGTASESE